MEMVYSILRGNAETLYFKESSSTPHCIVVVDDKASVSPPSHSISVATLASSSTTTEAFDDTQTETGRKKEDKDLLYPFSPSYSGKLTSEALEKVLREIYSFFSFIFFCIRSI